MWAHAANTLTTVSEALADDDIQMVRSLFLTSPRYSTVVVRTSFFLFPVWSIILRSCHVLYYPDVLLQALPHSSRSQSNA